MFEANLAAARQYHTREGHLTVPRKHIEALDGGGHGVAREIKLGVLISNVRSRRDKLTPERAAALNELGIA